MVTAIQRFELLFRRAAHLDVDKSDLKRLEDFLDQRLLDLLTRAQVVAHRAGRDFITLDDLPITLGLENCMKEFERIDAEVEVDEALIHLEKLPPLDLDYAEGLREELVPVVGGLVVALAKVFRILDHDVKNPMSHHWEDAERVFETLL